MLRYMKKLSNNQKGFTLLESVIAIAALSILSVFILQMFVVSSKVNQRAKDMDIAAAMVVTMIEELKVADSPVDFLSDEDNGDRMAIKPDDTGSFKMIAWYDKSWEPIHSGEDFNGNCFQLTLQVERIKDSPEEAATGLLGENKGLYSITAWVDSMMGKGSGEGEYKDVKRLVEYATKKYYPQ